MTTPMPLNMTEITRLMRAGQLSEATQMIQSNLGQPGQTQPSLNQPGLGMPKGLPMQGLSLPGLGQRLGQAAQDDPLPQGASWDWRDHSAAGQTRRARVYVPASLGTDAPAGLLLLLHGCTQDPDDFARGTGIMAAAEQHRMIVVAPGQTAQSNMNKCWNWFEPRHATQTGGEAAFLTDLTRSVAHDFAIPPDLRFAAGLSAGGAMAVILGAEFADDFGAVACHSGLPNGAASDMAGAFGAMSQGGSDRGQGVGCRLMVLHGSADATVSPRNGDAVVRQALRRQPGLVARAADARLEGRATRITRHRDAYGILRVEDWRIDGLGHAWSGGAPQGSHTAAGPSATQAMMKFFLA